MSARDDYPLTARLAEHQPAGNRQREATAILDELDRLRATEPDVCPDCKNPHQGGMQRPGGYSGCPTCGFCL